MAEVARVNNDLDYRVACGQFLQLCHGAILRVIVDENQFEFVFC